MINLEKAEKVINFTLNDSTINMIWQVKFYADFMRIIRSEKKNSVVMRDAYERYYNMKHARLSKDWLNKYFDIANMYLKEDKKPSSFDTLITDIGPEDNSVQFSFVSKLFHTLKNDEPIYDRHVRTFIETEMPSGKEVSDRMKSAVEIYNDDIKVGFYKNDYYIKLRELMLMKFNVTFPNVEGVSEIKKLDFVCWGLGKKKLKKSELEG